MNKNILIVGKFPPIQGGVSKLTYNTAKDLAISGNKVTILTNAEEADTFYKVNLLEEDYHFLTSSYPSGGKLSVINLSDSPFHCTPYSKSFETRLFGKGVEQIEENKPDVIIGWYYQPYGFVASLLAKHYDIKLILIHAGSDIGRLSKHPDFDKAYEKMLEVADYVFTSKHIEVHSQLKKLGVNSEKIKFFSGTLDMQKHVAAKMPGELEPYFELFQKWIMELPIESELKKSIIDSINVKPLNSNYPTIGIYGKVGEAKGTFQLMEALNGLNEETKFNFICIPLGTPYQLNKFFNLLLKYNRLNKVTKLLPPIPYWHIPNFISKCNIVCFLENGFDVHHSPGVPFEILKNEAALYISNDIIVSLNLKDVLLDDINCIVVDKVDHIPTLQNKIKKHLESPECLKNIAERGRKTIDAIHGALEKEPGFHQKLEQLI